MKQIVFFGRRAIPCAFQIGVEMDNLVEQIEFVLPQIMENQVATLYIKNGDYVDVVLLENNTWTVGNVTTQHAGEFECYIGIANGGDELWHSETFTAYVYNVPDIDEEIEQRYPTIVQQVEEAAARAVQAANTAVEAADGVEVYAELAQQAAQYASESSLVAEGYMEEARAAADEAKEMQEQITQISFSINPDME